MRLSSDVHESLPNDLHERHSFQDPEESIKFLKKTFHTIYRSKSVLSISNETDTDGKTKILTILNIKLPHQNGIDNLQVKVDDGAEANILPLDSFRTMCPHSLDENGYPTAGFLERSKINLEPWLYQAEISALLRKVISRPYFLCCRDQDSERNHHRTPSECQVRSHSCVMQECFQVYFSYRKLKIPAPATPFKTTD